MALSVKSIAVVLPRFGESLGGGAETLTKALVEALWCGGDITRRQIDRLEVWTTCARDHRTWANELPEGESVEKGILVRRFPVAERDLETFIRAEFAMRDGRALSIDEQLDWLANSVNSASLYSHIEQHGEEFDLILFAPYLFATTFWGAMIHPDRSVIIPCLHNEHYAFQEVFRVLFGEVRGLIFNAEKEQELAAELYGSEISERGISVGMGFEPVATWGPLADHERTPLNRFSDLPKRYVLYSGRKEQGKNLDLLIDIFEENQAELDDVELVIIGAGDLNFRPTLPENVHDLGFVTEEEKDLLIRDAVLLCQPSVNESFSIVMMEAWLRQTPVVVHALCPVTRDHVRRSDGGIYFANRRELVEGIKMISQSPKLRNTLGEAGRRYVTEYYSWDAVIGRFQTALRLFGFDEPEQLSAHEGA